MMPHSCLVELLLLDLWKLLVALLSLFLDLLISVFQSTCLNILVLLIFLRFNHVLNILFHIGVLCVGVHLGEAKVTKLCAAFLVDEDVRRFEVSVYDACGVEEIHAAQRVVQYCDHMILLKTILSAFIKCRF